MSKKRENGSIKCECGSKNLTSGDDTLLRIYCRKCGCTLYSKVFDEFYMRGVDFGRKDMQRTIKELLGIEG